MKFDSQKKKKEKPSSIPLIWGIHLFLLFLFHIYFSVGFVKNMFACIYILYALNQILKYGSIMFFS